MHRRKRKIGFIVFFSIPIIFICGYYLWVIYISHQFGKSVKKTVDKIIDNREYKRLVNDKDLLYKEILGNNQRATFTGIETRNDTIFTNALQIKSIDSNFIEYRIESLINWKSENDKSGNAKLDESSLGSENWKIANKEGILKPAYRFIENKDDCQIEILISKGNYKVSNSIVKEICKNKTKSITTKLTYK